MAISSLTPHRCCGTKLVQSWEPVEHQAAEGSVDRELFESKALDARIDAVCLVKGDTIIDLFHVHAKAESTKTIVDHVERWTHGSSEAKNLFLVG